MAFRRRLLLPVFFSTALIALHLQADPGDVESSQDYAGFPRLPGYLISDYNEDSPAEFSFPVSRPLPIDSDNIETVMVKGHRYVIRYELAPGGHAPSLFQTQQYYEKVAAAAGFTVEKSGAVGDSTETFHLAKAGHDIWVYLVPSLSVNVLTVVESSQPAHAPPLVSLRPPVPESAPVVAPTQVAEPTPDSGGDDDLYTALDQNGRVVLPLAFLPGKPQLDDESQPQIDRVVAMMNDHPEISLRIEGHTDSTGDAETNLRLSAERALAVQALLVAAHIDKKRLDAVGVGGLQPIADNDTAKGREKNRRIELVVWKKFPRFHSPAPNGQNYYPSAGASSTPARAGL